jgi:transposase
MWTEITRPQYLRKGLRYASDVTEAEWNRIEPHLPAAQLLGRPRKIEIDRGRQCTVLHRQNRVPMADAAARVSPLFDSAALLLCVAG